MQPGGLSAPDQRHRRQRFREVTRQQGTGRHEEARAPASARAFLRCRRIRESGLTAVPQEFQRHPRPLPGTRQAKRRTCATVELCPPVRGPAQRSSTMKPLHPAMPQAGSAHPAPHEPAVRTLARTTTKPPTIAPTSSTPSPRPWQIALIFRHLQVIPHVAIARFYGKCETASAIESRQNDRAKAAGIHLNSAQSAHTIWAGKGGGPRSSQPALQLENTGTSNAERCDRKRLARLAANAVAPAPTTIQQRRKAATSRQT